MGNSNKNCVTSEYSDKKEEYFEKVKKGYFTLIKKDVKKRFEANHHRKNNIQVSYTRKEFSKTKVKELNANKYKFIYWNKYLLTYLEKKINKGKIWAVNLKTSIKNECFISENKYLSLFFFYDYDIQTKPVIFNTFNNNKISNNDLIVNNTFSMINYSNVAQKIILPDIDNNTINSSLSSSTIKMSNVSEHLGDSFLSDKIDLVSSNDPGSNYTKNRVLIKQYFVIFREHIKRKDHPIRIVISLFAKEITKEINKIIAKIKNMKFSNKKEEQLYCIIKEIQQFVNHLQIAFKLMYARTINYKYFSEEKDEFVNLIISALFQKKKFFQSINELYKVTYNENVIAIEKQFYKFKDIKPNDIGVISKFSLNESTIQLMHSLLNEKTQTEDQRELIKTTILEKEKIIMNIKQNTQRKTSIDDEVINAKLNINEVSQYPSSCQASTTLSYQNTQHSIESYLPYSKEIESIKSLESRITPFQKLLHITNIYKGIIETINSFWKDLVPTLIDQEHLTPTPDDLMSILTYILIQAKTPSIFIDIKITNDFTCSETKSTVLGYNFTLLEACFFYIEKHDLRKSIINTSKFNSKLILPFGNS